MQGIWSRGVCPVSTYWRSRSRCVAPLILTNFILSLIRTLALNVPLSLTLTLTLTRDHCDDITSLLTLPLYSLCLCSA